MVKKKISRMTDKFGEKIELNYNKIYTTVTNM